MFRLLSAQQATSNMSRNRRGVAVPASSSRPIRLNVKAPPSKLREVTNSREKMSRGAKRNPIVEMDESEDDEDAESDEDEDEDEEDDDEDEEEDAEGDPEDEDDDMEDDEEPAPPPPRIKINAPVAVSRKPAPEQKLQQRGVKAVEDQEMDDESDELSDGPEDDELEGDEDEEMLDDDEHNDTINSAAIDDEDLDSEDDEDGTPDPNKLTRRQRGNADAELMALSNEAQKKKFFTAEQLSLRRAEMARRRKDLSEKRTQSEKDETLRRLLHKPAPKRRSRAQMLADAEREEFGTPGVEGQGVKPNKMFIRTISNASGSVVCVPEEWSGSPAGRLFDQARKEQKQDPPAALQPFRMVQVIAES